MPFQESKKAKRRNFYLEKALVKSKKNYDKNKDAMKASNSTYRKKMHRANPEKERAASNVTTKRYRLANLLKSRAATRASYHSCPEHSRALSRKNSLRKILSMLGLSLERVQKNYTRRTEGKVGQLLGQAQKKIMLGTAKRRLSKKLCYRRNPLSNFVYSKRLYAKKPSAKTRANKAYYAKRRNTLRALCRDKYALAEPLHARKEAIKRALQTNLLSNKDVKDQLVEAFKNEHPTSAQTMSSKLLKRTVCKIAATELLDKGF